MRLFLLIFIPLLFIGCSSSNVAGGTGVGNPTENKIGMTSISVLAEDKTNSRAAESEVLEIVDMSGNRYTIESLLIHLSTVSWEVEMEGLTELDPQLTPVGEELVLEGPFEFNALTGELITGDYPEVKLPETVYKQVRFYMEENPEKPSVTLSGTVNSGSKSTPFTFEFPLEIELKFAFDEHGRSILLGDAQKELVLNLGVDSWFQFFDPLTLATGSEKHVIDASTVSPGSLHSVRNSIRESGSLVISD